MLSVVLALRGDCVCTGLGGVLAFTGFDGDIFFDII
nr:MAG TPA: hypothetical protein [Caudoviricetes sp.]